MGKKKKSKIGRKVGTRNAYPKAGSLAAAVVNQLITGAYVSPTDTARELGCSVPNVIQARDRWTNYITEQRKLRKKEITDDANS